MSAPTDTGTDMRTMSPGSRIFLEYVLLAGAVINNDSDISVQASTIPTLISLDHLCTVSIYFMHTHEISVSLHEVVR